MPDQATIESVASKFQAWADSLSGDEQATLAEWWSSNVSGDGDVQAHGNWWQGEGAWSSAWSKSWSW